MRRGECIAAHTVKVRQLCAEGQGGHSGDTTQLEDTELEGGSGKREGCTERSSGFGLKGPTLSFGEVGWTTPEQNAVGEGGDDVPLDKRANGCNIDTSIRESISQ